MFVSLPLSLYKMDNMNPLDTEEKLLQALDQTRGELKLTKEEETRLKGAFKEPEFKKLLGEYMQEISDPKNRQEYEKYINQMEGDNKVPKDMRIVKPKGGFVLKTRKRGPKAKASDAPNEKVFINVCSAEEVQTPSATKKGAGQSWSLPHIIGAPHMVQDKNGVPCTTFEVAFHPETIQRALSSVDFKKMVANVAFEAIKTNYKKFAGGNANLEDKWRILKGVQAFGGAPGMLSLKKTKEEIEKDEKAGKAKTEQENKAPAGPKKPALAKGFMNPKKNKKKKKKKKGNNLVQDITAADGEEFVPTGPVVPKCVIVERGIFDLKDTIHVREQMDLKRPKELVCKISLPKVDSIGSVDLDVDDCFLCLEVQDMYVLERKLPYAVFGDKGSAKWLKSKRQLVVTVPVKPPRRGSAPPEGNVPTEEGGTTTEEDAKIAEVSLDDAPVEEVLAESVPANTPPPAEEATAPASDPPAPPPSSSPPSTPNIPGLSPEMMKKLAEARQAYESWKQKGDDEAEAEEKRVEEAAAKREAEFAKANPEAAEAMKEPEEKFIPCETFSGKKDGFCFKMGDEGLGYYWDAVAKGGRIKSFKASKKKTAAVPVIQKEASSTRAGEYLPLPEYTFRQDKSTLSIIVQVKGIPEEAVRAKYKPDAVYVRFSVEGALFGLKITAPESCEVDVRACRFSANEKNLAIIVGKMAPSKWRLNVEKLETDCPVFAEGGSTEGDATDAQADEEAEEKGKKNSGHKPLANKLFLELD